MSRFTIPSPINHEAQTSALAIQNAGQLKLLSMNIRGQLELEASLSRDRKGIIVNGEDLSCNHHDPRRL